MKKIYLWLRKRLLHIDDRSPLRIAVDNGMKVGRDCQIMEACSFDPSHSWLIEIGDRVTIAPRVQVLAHDASTKRELGYTRIARVSIGNDVFIGMGSILLPGVHIGDKVIIGAGSVVTKDIPGNSVAAGNPCRVIETYEDYISKRRESTRVSPCYDRDYLIGRITPEGKERMKEELSSAKEGYIV